MLGTHRKWELTLRLGTNKVGSRQKVFCGTCKPFTDHKKATTIRDNDRQQRLTREGYTPFIIHEIINSIWFGTTKGGSGMMVQSESWSHIRPYWPLLYSFIEKHSCDLKGIQIIIQFAPNYYLTKLVQN